MLLDSFFFYFGLPFPAGYEKLGAFFLKKCCTWFYFMI